MSDICHLPCITVIHFYLSNGSCIINNLCLMSSDAADSIMATVVSN